MSEKVDLSLFAEAESARRQLEEKVQRMAEVIEYLRREVSEAAPAAPADRTELRDRIGQALVKWTYREKDPEHLASGILQTVRANAYSRADAVLAVLPADTGQTAEIQRLRAEIERLREHDTQRDAILSAQATEGRAMLAEIQRLQGNSEGDRAIIEHLRTELRGARATEKDPDAAAYRHLRDAILATMSDPDTWDGDDDEETILTRYVQQLAATPSTPANRATVLREAAERLRAKAGEEWPGIGVLLEDIVSVVLADEAQAAAPCDHAPHLIDYDGSQYRACLKCGQNLGKTDEAEQQ